MNKNTKLALIAISSATLFIGCNKSKTENDSVVMQQKIENQIHLANDHLNHGEPKTALNILENLEHSHPDQASVLEALAFAHASQNDNELAAFYFDQVFRLDPSNIEACLFAAEAYNKVGQLDMAVKNYETYIQTYAKDESVWKTLSNLYTSIGRPHAAFKSFLTYTKLKATPITEDESLTLAKLSHQLGNIQQAESWYTAALQNENTQEEALMGLLQINLTNQNWDAIQNIVLILDEVNPLALNNSNFSGVRAELKSWQTKTAAQVNENLNAVSTANQESQQPSIANKQQEPNNTPENKFAKKWKRKNTYQPAIQNKYSQTEEIKMENSTPKESFMAESKTQEWANDPSLNQVETVDKTLQLVLNSIVSHSQGLDLTTDAIASAENPFLPNAVKELQAPKPGITAKEIKALPIKPPPTPVKEPEPSDFFAEGKKLKSLGRFEDAIQEYWQAVSLDDTPANFWNELSETYLLDKQFEEAEMTALEALRRDPSNLGYTLNFLRAAYKTKPVSTFIEELNKAEQRFPKSPEITLALARAYESDSIEQNPRKAAAYYNKFVQQYPSHPMKTEAETALHRLQ